MPLHTSTTTLKDIIHPVEEIREEGECRVEITTDPDQVRLSSISDNWNLAVDYSIPLTTQSVEQAPATFWVTVDKIGEFLRTNPGDTVTVRFPFETPDSRMVLESNGLTYRFAPFKQRAKDRVDPGPLPDTRTVFTLPNFAFERSLRVGNLIDDALTVEYIPTANQVEIEPNNPDTDDFTYESDVGRIEAVERSATKILISTKALQSICSRIPEDALATFEVTATQLIFRVEHPVEGATFTMQLAERKRSVH